MKLVGGDNRMLVTKDGCAYKVLANIYEFYNEAIPEFMARIGCERCDGRKTCKTTLAELVIEREKHIEEMMLA